MLAKPLLISLAVLFGSAVAHAQINPFWSSTRAGGHLTNEDLRRLDASIDRLNTATPPRIGQTDSWSNPNTRSSGSSILRRVFQSGGMTCHLLQHHISAAGKRPGSTFDLTWCRTSNGEWKIKS